ncbi:MAG: hypothetical protein WCQ66_03980 [Sphaerochaetaceae bacterium]|jgi:hypothetical protein
MQSQPTKKYILSDMPQRGLVRVIDLQNDKTLLVASEDIEKDIIDIRFKLDLEMYPCEELQKAYTATGLELFSIEPYLIATSAEDLASLLKAETEKLSRKGVRLYRS